MSRFARIASQRIYQQIVDQISRLIQEGTLKPGDRLPSERQLAEEFGVSRPAVREALSALGLTGLVEVRHGEGTFVRSTSEEGLVHSMALFLTLERHEAMGRELLEIRTALEAESAFLAAQRSEADDLQALEEALREMESAMNQGELGAEADWKFHRALASASGNGLLLQIMQMLTESMQESLKLYRERLLRIPGMNQMLFDEHRGIFAAIQDRQPELARDRMHNHILRVQRTLYGDAPAGPQGGSKSWTTQP